jgi:hypothetical protein
MVKRICTEKYLDNAKTGGGRCIRRCRRYWPRGVSVSDGVSVEVSVGGTGVLVGGGVGGGVSTKERVVWVGVGCPTSNGIIPSPSRFINATIIELKHPIRGTRTAE